MHSPDDREIEDAEAARGDKGTRFYKVQDGCWNCGCRFLKWGSDEDPQLYCNRRADRPARCGSVEMNESFFLVRMAITKDVIYIPDDEAKASMAAWRAWADAHAVHDAGICNFHSKEK